MEQAREGLPAPQPQEEAAGGEQAAGARIQRIYARDYAGLCATAHGILGESALAQDAVQNAWLRLSNPRTLAGLDTSDETRLRSLVQITVRNAAYNLRRSTKHEQTIPDESWEAIPDEARGPAGRLEQKDALRALKSALRRLEEVDQSILLLQYDNGCTGRQIAALLGLREAAVRKRAERAKKKLKSLLLEGGAFDEKGFRV